MNEQQIYFSHFDHRVTAAYLVTNDHIRVAFARCNGKDQFCRKIGREIAKGRLLKHGGQRIPGVNPQSTHRAVYASVSAMVRQLGRAA